MAKCFVEFPPTVIGVSISNIQWDFCKKISDMSNVATTSSSLIEMGLGCYILYNPNITEDTAFRIKLTDNPDYYCTGVLSLVDGDAARQSTLNTSSTTILQNLGIHTTGSIPVDHNYPTTDSLRYLDVQGSGIDNASIVIYLKDDYINNNKSKDFIKGSSTTKMDGRWNSPIYLDSDLTFIVEFYKQGEFQVTTSEITT